MKNAPLKLRGILFFGAAYLEDCCAGFGYCVILSAGAAAYSDCTDYFAVLLEGDAAGEDHDLAVVGGVDAEELVAGLGVLG